MTAAADLIKRAVSDLEHGWYEAAIDCLGRAIRASEAARWDAVEQRLGRVVSEMAQIVADMDARLRALEQRGASRLHPKLAELNEFRRGDAQRLDEAIKAILAAAPGRPTAKEVRRTLQSAAFHPLPSERTLCHHLAGIRGKRQHTVMSQTGDSAPLDPSILQP